MKERGILFSAPMVRALLDGSKTQTRRVVKLPVDYDAAWRGGWKIVHKKVTQTVEMFNQLRGNPLGSDTTICPYGQPGDWLWVRETWQGPLFGGDDVQAYQGAPESFNHPRYCQYAADGGPAPEFLTLDDELVCRWRPSIHMPRWASRILLQITGVRVERLQDISEADCLAEGIHAIRHEGDGTYYHYEHTYADPGNWCDADTAYQHLWESINGAGSWDANPWVWVVEFKRVQS